MKITGTIVAATMALVFFGCSAGDEGETKPSGTSADEVKASEKEAPAKDPAPVPAPAPSPSSSSSTQGQDVPANFETSCTTLVSCTNGVCKCGDGTICEADQCALQCRVCS